MNAVVGESTEGNDNEGGPMWGKFFESIGNDDEGSAISGSHMTAARRTINLV